METYFVETPVLNIGYHVVGPEEGTPVLLLHGFPDDAQSWEPVMQGLAQHGYRTYAPYLRGFGPTTFLSANSPRSGQNAALAQDTVDFADALGLQAFTLVGHDWGANAGQAVAAIYPERVRHLISFSPYSITWDDYQGGLPNYPQIHALWYLYVLQSEIGEGLLYGDAKGFARYLWQTWSPTWSFTESDFERTAASFDNPDFAQIVLNAYRWEPSGHDATYTNLEKKLAQRPPISVPTTVLLGREDGVNIFAPPMLEQTADFRGQYRATVTDGVGHFIHRERPDVVIEALVKNV
ncbi:MAG: alpha/beta hydrolase [Chloroflexi bacterium]|nr:alpha/beta hydrolase [Chloroflexota bacterium]